MYTLGLFEGHGVHEMVGSLATGESLDCGDGEREVLLWTQTGHSGGDVGVDQGDWKPGGEWKVRKEWKDEEGNRQATI